MICRLLVVSLMLLQFPMARAGMIGVDQMVSGASVQTDGMASGSVLTRSEIVRQLQALGVDAKLAQDRTAALTDAEVLTLQGKMNTMPAGAGGISGWGWVLLIAVGLAVYFYWK